LTEQSSERRALTTGGAGGRDQDDDMLTVLNDDNLSISGFSDLRSQRSRLGAQSVRNVDLYQNIIEEEDEDGDDDDSDGDNNDDENKSQIHGNNGDENMDGSRRQDPN